LPFVENAREHSPHLYGRSLVCDLQQSLEIINTTPISYQLLV
jgi:hypothetical protein